MKRLLSYDPVTKIKEFFVATPELNDDYELVYEQDTTDIVEANRGMYNEYTSLDRWGDGRRVASIPLPLYYELKRKGVTEDQAAFKRWLNDPENRFFRTSPGRV